MPTQINTDRFVWIDLETFGLNENRDPILEIGCIITDVNLKTIDDFQCVIWDSPMYDKRYEEAQGNFRDEWVLKMHTKSGLFSECMDEGMSVEGAYNEFVHWLGGHGINKGDAMCGSSVAFDRKFLDLWMPKASSLFSYRNVDVSAVKEICARWNAGLFARLEEATSRQEKHRVLPDLADTIAEARFYGVEFMLVGPDVEL